MLYPVEKLLENRDPPLCVREGDTVRDALVHMVANDYSQLPIIDQAGLLAGLISEQSITRTQYHLGDQVSVLDLPVEDCRDKAITLAIDRDFFDVLERLKASYAVVIVEDRRPIGILTHYDTANFFRDLTEGLILVEDIEVTLRKRIEDALSDEEKRSRALQNAFHHLPQSQGRTITDFEEMTLGDTISLVTTKTNWGYFEDQFSPKGLFQQYMEQVREIRNQLAHFRGRIDAVQYDLLRRAREWLASRPRVVQTAPATAIAEPATQYVAGKSGGKYGPLYDWLGGLAIRASSGYRIEQRFGDLQELLGDELPPSAFEHQAWWANDVSRGRHARAWMRAGWKVDDVDFANETVTFVRTDSVRYQIFFDDLLTRLKKARPGVTRATRVYPENYFGFSGGRSGFEIGWRANKEESLTVYLYINPGSRETNDAAFEYFRDREARLETALSAPIIWEPREHTTTARFQVVAVEPFSIQAPDAKLEEAKGPALDMMIRFVDTVRPMLRELNLP